MPASEDHCAVLYEQCHLLVSRIRPRMDGRMDERNYKNVLKHTEIQELLPVCVNVVIQGVLFHYCYAPLFTSAKINQSPLFEHHWNYWELHYSSLWKNYQTPSLKFWFCYLVQALGLKTIELHLAKECYNIGTKAHHPHSTRFNLSLNRAATGGK